MMTTINNGPWINAIGWTAGQDYTAISCTREDWPSMANPIAFSDGQYQLKAPAADSAPTALPLPLMRSSGVSRARSAAKSTIFSALLGKKLLETMTPDGQQPGSRIGVAIASSSAITPIAWEFETVGLRSGWNRTDTMLLPSSIPSAITTQISAVFDIHAAAIAFQDGAFGICSALEYAHLSFAHQRSDHFLIMGADEICQVQCDAMQALEDHRPRIDGAAGLVVGRSPLSRDDWQLALCSNVTDAGALTFPDAWQGADILELNIAHSATLFTAPLIPYALHHLLHRAQRRALLVCSLPGRGRYVLGFEQARRHAQH